MASAAQGARSTGVMVAWITAPAKEASSLAGKLVEARLVACVNITPAVTSVYEWEGKVEEDTESLMMCKTTSERADALIDFVKTHHSYDCPEVILTDVVKGNPGYLSFVHDNTAPPEAAE